MTTRKLTLTLTLPTLLTLAAALLATSGCTTPPYDPKPNTAAATAGSKIVFIDKDLRRVLTVDSIGDCRTAAGLLTLTQVALRNTTNDETLALQIQTIFLTADGEALYTGPGSDTAWQNLTLTPGQTAYYKQNALTPAAQTYTIRIRYMNRKDAGN
jgi:hypothetical protein